MRKKRILPYFRTFCQKQQMIKILIIDMANRKITTKKSLPLL
ncbi:hypothetical protein DDI_3686 [Dickeya dianthicola RNS04.9]|nr:hypothetical protein DDI_3686 [Dickeya dianthicola RNS04.9]